MNKIRLPRDGAEYAHFTFSPAVPEDVVLEASIGGVWVEIEQPVGALPRLLLRGPDTTSGTPGVLVPVEQPLRVRIKGDPEVIVRGAGHIVLVG